MEPRAFQIHVPDVALDELAWRLDHTRWPRSVADSGWEYGLDLDYVRELCRYWRHDYDWRATEERLNALPQYLLGVDGVDLHYVHRRSSGARPFPLLLLHGWPGSLFEYVGLVEPLTGSSGSSDPAVTYDVVVASLPGFGFGGQPTTKGWGVSRIARAMDTLMSRLGYEEYGAVGGDWGGAVSAHLGASYPERCVAVHTTPQFAPTPRTQSADLGVRMSEFRGRLKNELGYAQIQRTKPDSVTLAQNDSPAGLAAWIVEKFRAWGDTGGDVERVFDKDTLLSNVMFYWAPQSVASSARIYHEMVSDRAASAYPRVEVPAAIAAFAAEPFQLPRSVVEARYNVVRWTDFERGGHFPALEMPQALTADIREFFSSFG